MYKFEKEEWKNISEIATISFICWNCNNKVASEKAYISYDKYDPSHVGSYIYICPHCKAPVILDDEEKEVLLPLLGAEIKKLPENIGNVYEEVRRCMQSKCFTGAIMLMRKIIMNIAVHEGAEENLKFVQYVDFLFSNGIVPKKSKNKVDSVKDLGNDANHKLENRTQEEAPKLF